MSTTHQDVWRILRDQTDKRGTRRVLNFEATYPEAPPMRIDVKFTGTTSQVANAGDELVKILSVPEEPIF